MTSRRIRKLHLSAQNAALIRRGAILVEDAFHTASLSSFQRRLLVVRSLSLGLIRHNQSSAAIARVIEERLRLLSTTAVYAEDPSAPYSPAVYFQDEAEPYIMLAVRAARDLSTDAWFWPLALPCFHSGMSAGEAVRALLHDSQRLEAKISVVVAIAIALIENGAANKLASALRWEDGPRLLRSINCGEPETPSSFSSFVDAGRGEFDQLTIPVRWSDALYSCVQTWGADDARSIWLASSLLIADKPARALVPALSLRAQQLIILITNHKAAVSSRSCDPGKSGAETPQLGFAQKVVLEASVGGEEEKHQHSRDFLKHQHSRDFLGKAPQLTEAAASVDQQVLQAKVPRATVESEKPDFTQVVAAPLASASEILPPGDFNARKGDDSSHDQYFDSGGVATRKAKADRITPPDYSGARLFGSSNNSLFTNYGGIFFLLRVMSRLGIETLLSTNPHLTEYDLPARLLIRVCARLDIPSDDPVMSALIEMCPGQAPDLCEFVQPALWKQGINDKRPLILGRVEDSPQEQILFDGSSRLALAMWRGTIPNAARQIFCDPKVGRRTTIKPRAGLDLLLDSWLTAMRRWCRRCAQVGLHDIVCRPGHLSVTRTHVDVVFDHRRTDIRIRKAGLDLDLGWVPWFGRVISFHYQYGEYSDE